MAKKTNTNFTVATKSFLSKYFISYVRIKPFKSKGTVAFDMHEHTVGGNKLVTIDLYKPRWSIGFNEAPLLAYWAPQGFSCLVPVKGKEGDLVFTPDLSGCSIVVDQISLSQYRVYHVQGGSNYLKSEYLADSIDHGMGLAGALTFSDYGTIEKPRTYGFLKFEKGRWWIYYQCQNGVGLRFNYGKFMAVGPQTVRGGGKIPVANLAKEAPYSPPTINKIKVVPKVKSDAKKLIGEKLTKLPDELKW